MRLNSSVLEGKCLLDTTNVEFLTWRTRGELGLGVGLLSKGPAFQTVLPPIIAPPSVSVLRDAGEPVLKLK